MANTKLDRIAPSVPPLMGTAEVAEALQVTVSNLQYIKDLPEPVQELRCGRIWRASDVMAFVPIYASRRRKAA